MTNIVLIGDSIRMGYQSTVIERLADSAAVWAPEGNGGHVVNVLMHLHLWAKHRQPDLIHINSGLHDIKTDYYGPSQPLVPLPIYAAYVERILRYLREHTKATVIWATTTPVIDDIANAEHTQWQDFHRANADVVAYNGVAVAICRRHDVPVNDLYAVVAHHGVANLHVGDGVHYSPAGSRILGEAVASCIRSHLR